MKQTKLILIAILCGVFLVLGGMLIWGITGSGYIRINRGAYEEDGKILGKYIKVLEYETPASQVKQLNILFDKNSNDIYFYESENENILIKEYVNKEPSEKEKTTIKEATGVLTVEGKKKNHGISLGFNNEHGYVEVYLPTSYQGDLKACSISGDILAEMDFILSKETDFTMSSTSGNIELLKVEAENVDISTVSGDVNIKELNADTSISTTSGDVDVEDCDGDCKINTVSGDVGLEDLKGEFDVSTTSGGLEIERIAGGGEVSTVSGDISLQFDALKADLDISTVSGWVSIYLPKEAALHFDASTTSGEINTFFDEELSFNKKGNKASGTYGDGSAYDIEIDTTSGDVEVRSN